MIEKIQNTYTCEYCRKRYIRKDMAISHELKCKKNPENIKKCSECKFLHKVNITFFGDDYDGEEKEITSSTFHCKKKDIYMQSLAWDFKPTPAIYVDNEEVTQGKMPIECKEFESYIPKF